MQFTAPTVGQDLLGKRNVLLGRKSVWIEKGCFKKVYKRLAPFQNLIALFEIFMELRYICVDLV